MTWTTERPSASGWYWLRRRGLGDAIVEVLMPPGIPASVFWTSGGWSPLSHVDGEWAGPIPAPAEVQP